MPHDPSQSFAEQLELLLLKYKNTWGQAFNEIDPHGKGLSAFGGHKAVAERSDELEAEAIAAITTAHEAAIKEARLDAFREVLQAIDDMQKAYADTGRTVSKGELVKWIEYELGIKHGRT